MIPFRNMTYCDIHTHQGRASSQEYIVIINKIADINHSLCFLPGYYYSYGIHPWYTENSIQLNSLLIEAALHPSVIALGEAGLDKNSKTPISTQIELFSTQAELAEEMGKPVIIHCVKAWDELLSVKKKIDPKMPWIIHGFRGNQLLAKQLIDKGLWLSFGELFNPDALKAAWPNRMFTETDESEKGIEEIYSRIAESLGISIDLLALRLRGNVKEVFSV